ncbi:uncharacterized protein TM35_000012930 [Trypanosoma theileri]|uniref:Uncharacterized protein n=1 Tax=Trypanosoma theileri TaxID=67003 RepID=A0A1X0P921_9TRYP|nr:uncharacterized protein TM35_000012930 [Trypanosoma theileri]ORC93416.1 hypothetical protein TM35_000012930 [Trypanosoma theileri]
METELARMLQDINWEGFQQNGESVTGSAPAKSSPLQQKSAFPHSEGNSVRGRNVSVPTEGLVDDSALLPTSIPMQQQQQQQQHPPPPPQQQQQPQQLPTMQMPPAGGGYYVNPAAFQAMNMAQAAGRAQVQAQPMMFAQPNGQMMYVRMPYYQQSPYQHGHAPQQMYPAPQNLYYPTTYFMQPSADGSIMHTVPQAVQCFAPPKQFARGGTAGTQPPPPPPPPATPQQQQLQQQQQQLVDVNDAQGGFVCLLPGTQLPQGMPFFPYGVRPTHCFATAPAREHSSEPPQYNVAVAQMTSQFVGTAVGTELDESMPARENKQNTNTLACTSSEHSNFVPDNALGSNLHVTPGNDGVSPVSLQGSDGVMNA